ncbi:MAG: hypothetical protein LBS17_00320 [Actinomycetes bacterium]|jgi:hypothetical protein|nr:hypothetical protein [Actinomycetes bacterium]
MKQTDTGIVRFFVCTVVFALVATLVTAALVHAFPLKLGSIAYSDDSASTSNAGTLPDDRRLVCCEGVLYYVSQTWQGEALYIVDEGGIKKVSDVGTPFQVYGSIIYYLDENGLLVQKELPSGHVVDNAISARMLSAGSFRVWDRYLAILTLGSYELIVFDLQTGDMLHRASWCNRIGLWENVLYYESADRPFVGAAMGEVTGTVYSWKGEGTETVIGSEEDPGQDDDFVFAGNADEIVDWADGYLGISSIHTFERIWSTVPNADDEAALEESFDESSIWLGYTEISWATNEKYLATSRRESLDSEVFSIPLPSFRNGTWAYEWSQMSERRLNGHAYDELIFVSEETFVGVRRDAVYQIDVSSGREKQLTTPLSWFW